MHPADLAAAYFGLSVVKLGLSDLHAILSLMLTCQMCLLAAAGLASLAHASLPITQFATDSQIGDSRAAA